MSDTLTLTVRPAQSLTELDSLDSHHVSSDPTLIGIRSVRAFKKAIAYQDRKLSPLVGGRVGAWYRQEYPVHTAKEIQRENNCAPATAKAWLRGDCPSNEALFRMFSRIDGERSGLWQEYYRLIREIRPRFVVVENSSALTFRGLGRVLGDLAEGGYDAEWQCIPAAAVGAPHIRDRVWILAYPRRELRDVRQGFMADGRCIVLPTGDDRDTTERREDRELIALVPGIDPRVPADWWRAQSRMDRSVDGLPNRAQRVAALGNAVVPQIPEMIGRAILQTASGEEAA